jgi:uncharacterized protein (TIGR00296 family)
LVSAIKKDSTQSPFIEQDGKLLVSLAREAIERYLISRHVAVPSSTTIDARFEIKLGCFVTLKENNPEESLRGCIGFAEPVFKLSKALPQAAIAAATEDPRFAPVSVAELRRLMVEVSILTVPKIIETTSQKNLPKLIELGRDGLILRWTFGSGLLLPQVAKEYGWDAEEFLANLSMKAGAPPDQWLVQGSTVLKFQAQVFKETSPMGTVVLED